VLANAADPRLKTCLILNAGMGKMKMADASRIGFRESMLCVFCGK